MQYEVVDECWEYTGGISSNGYGNVNLATGGTRSAHRVAWEQEYGPIPKGMFVLHRCDNKLCIRPQHLFLGTQADNVADKVSKNRQARGELSGSATLTEEEVKLIRWLTGEGYTDVEVALQFGVTNTTVGQIRKRKTWRHI